MASLLWHRPNKLTLSVPDGGTPVTKEWLVSEITRQQNDEFHLNMFLQMHKDVLRRGVHTLTEHDKGVMLLHFKRSLDLNASWTDMQDSDNMREVANMAFPYLYSNLATFGEATGQVSSVKTLKWWYACWEVPIICPSDASFKTISANLYTHTWRNMIAHYTCQMLATDIILP